MPRRRRAEDDRRPVSIRLRPETVARLDAECDRRVLGRNLLIELILTKWLDAAEGQDLA